MVRHREYGYINGQICSYINKMSFHLSNYCLFICPLQDVAARGLDLPKVCWIVQFNAACSAADYVHRVGRTARVDAPGSALIFLAPAEAPYIRMLEEHKIM